MKRLHALVVLVLLLLASQPVAPAGAAWLPAYNYGVNWSPWPAGFIDASDCNVTGTYWQNTLDYDPVGYEYAWASAVQNNIPNLYLLNTQTHGGPGYQVYFYLPGRPRTDSTSEYVSCLRSDRSNPPDTHEHMHAFYRLDGSIFASWCNHYRYVSDVSSTNLRVVLLGSCYSSALPNGAGSGLADSFKRIGADCTVGFNEALSDDVPYRASLRYSYHSGFWKALNEGKYVSEAVTDAERLVYRNFGYCGQWTNNVIRGTDRRF